MQIKRILSIATLAVLCIESLPSQSLFRSMLPQNFPSGNAFVENFGNWRNPSPASPAGTCFYDTSASPITFTGSGCRNPWEIGAGSDQSITTCPAGISLYAGQKCLRMNQTTVSAYIRTTGTFPSVPSSISDDEYITFQVASHTVAGSDLTNFLCWGDQTCATIRAKIFFAQSSGNLVLKGSGSTMSSATGTVSLNATHTVQIHMDATAANCYIAVDGGAHATFTCNSNPITHRLAGRRNGNLDPVDFYLSSWTGNNSQGSGFPPTYWTSFESSGGAGTTVTTSTMATGTIGGACTWAVAAGSSGGTATPYLTAEAQMPLLNLLTVNGTQYTDTGSVGLYAPQTESATATPNVFCTFATPSLSASDGFMFSTSVTAPSSSAGYAIGIMGNSNDNPPLHYRPINNDCTGVGTPVQCCTGIGTGTCPNGRLYSNLSNTVCTGAGTPFGWCSGAGDVRANGGTLAGAVPINTFTTTGHCASASDGCYWIQRNYNSNPDTGISGATAPNFHTFNVYSVVGATLTYLGAISYPAFYTAGCQSSGVPWTKCTGSGTASVTAPGSYRPVQFGYGRIGTDVITSDTGGFQYDNFKVYLGNISVWP